MGPWQGDLPLPDGGIRSAFVHRVFGRHAAALVAIAALILDDLDAASDVVSDAIASMDARGPTLDPDGQPARAQLAASVYRHCLARLAVEERLPDTIPLSDGTGGASARLARLSLRHRAAVALVLLGEQDLPTAADTLGVTEHDVREDLAQAVELIRLTKSPT